MKERILPATATVLVTAVLGTAAPASAQTALSACGALTKGSYKLTRNLTTTGSCLTVVNNFVTIDLNGFTITGDGGRDDYGIRTGAVTDRTGIEIRNGTITNFGEAISLGSATVVVVERVRALRNTGFVSIRLGSYCVARDNVAAENFYIGMILGAGCVASGNNASDNGNDGFLLNNGTASGNVARYNQGDGIIGNPGSTLVNNSASRNSGRGISVYCPSNALGNTATNNGAANIVFSGEGCGKNFNVAP